jgi:hypothetical protein
MRRKKKKNIYLIFIWTYMLTLKYYIASTNSDHLESNLEIEKSGMERYTIRYIAIPKK